MFERIPKNKKKVLENYILEGLQLIKNEEYFEADEYFLNPHLYMQMALLSNLNPVGIFTSGFRRVTIVRDRLTKVLKVPEDAAPRQIMCEISAVSWFASSENRNIFKRGSGEGTIKTVSIIPTAIESYIIDPKKGLYTLPQEVLLHNVITTAEEWFHGYQLANGGPVVKGLNDELDVAAYFIQNQVPLTEYFLEMHSRDEVFNSESDTPPIIFGR